MCGRFLLIREAEAVAERFALAEVPALQLRYNIAPTQTTLVIRQDVTRVAESMRWGLIPSWAKDPSIGSKALNARSETVAEKPVFRSAYKKRRCLIPADGFYEWQKTGKAKQALAIKSADGGLLAFAGLWEQWQDLTTFTILTAEANDQIRPFHDRRPVIIPPSDFDLWLDVTADPQRLFQQSVPLTITPVSSFVNNVRNQGPECLESAPSLFV
jgi:putative SOS response-associated peptidase YedK